MLRSNRPLEVNESWDKLITKEERDATEIVMQLIADKVPKYERASNEINNVASDIPKDPYTGMIAKNADSKEYLIHTDGKLEILDGYVLAGVEMRNYRVTNYNYILVEHKDTKLKGNQTFYSCLIFKRREMKLYVQWRTGRGITG